MRKCVVAKRLLLLANQQAFHLMCAFCTGSWSQKMGTCVTGFQSKSTLPKSLWLF